MKLKKVLATVLASAMALTMLAGCGSGSSGGGQASSGSGSGAQEAPAQVQDITLKVWCPQNQVDTKTMEQQQAAFAEAHPEYNITWTTEIVGEDTAKEQILKDVGAAADVFFFANDQLEELVNAGASAAQGCEPPVMPGPSRGWAAIPRLWSTKPSLRPSLPRRRWATPFTGSLSPIIRSLCFTIRP